MFDKRDPLLYIQDILESIDAIKNYTDSINYEQFSSDRKTYSACIREFTIIGEAIGKIFNLCMTYSPDYEWRMIKDFRNIIVHEYFGIDLKIVWDLIQFELQSLANEITHIKRSISQN